MMNLYTIEQKILITVLKTQSVCIKGFPPQCNKV